jgi:hypothetical protein
MMYDGFPAFLRIIVIAAAFALGGAATAAAQATNVGRGKCVDCHDHKDEKDWALTRDGDGKGKQHINAFNQLEDPKAAKFAAAIGVDPYDPKSTCVKCHATVLRGEPVDGITCESCHGPGSQYLVPHQTKGAYQQSIALGMKDVVKKPQAWARDCLTCHVLGAYPGDAKIADAGHPTGSDFDLSRKYVNVALHFQSKYTGNEVAAAGGNLRTELLARLKGGSAATPTATVAAAPPAAAPPATPPKPAATPAPATPAPVTPAPAPTPAAPAPSATTPAASPTTATKPPAVPPSSRPPLTAPPPGLPAAPPAAVPTPAPATPVTTEPTAVAAADPVAVPEPTLPTTPAGIVAAVQGRIAALLDRLLGAGVSAPLPVTPPQRKTVYRGPDADLLRLQEEVIALALEALGSKPAPKTQTPPQQ